MYKVYSQMCGGCQFHMLHTLQSQRLVVDMRDQIAYHDHGKHPCCVWQMLLFASDKLTLPFTVHVLAGSG